MPRNPINPRQYTENPKSRAEEKLKVVLEMLIDFHYSTRELILAKLKLATNSHHRYFSSLEKKKIIRKVGAPSIRSNYVYMLTSYGVELANEKISILSPYQIDGNKINHSNLRHNLAIQRAVISMVDNYDVFIPERRLPHLNLNDEKRPDGCLEKNGVRTMLEIELTAKTDQRIFRALVAHAKAINKNHYSKVIYIFPSLSLANYYTTRYQSTEWPTYTQNERGVWIRSEDSFKPDNFLGLRNAFEFLTESDLTKNF